MLSFTICVHGQVLIFFEAWVLMFLIMKSFYKAVLETKTEGGILGKDFGLSSIEREGRNPRMNLCVRLLVALMSLSLMSPLVINSQFYSGQQYAQLTKTVHISVLLICGCGQWDNMEYDLGEGTPGRPLKSTESRGKHVIIPFCSFPPGSIWEHKIILKREKQLQSLMTAKLSSHLGLPDLEPMFIWNASYWCFCFPIEN